ncbi:hypothetical protein GT037_009152 [Alternaria burnsii]|uniref:Heterokaryon incompatibility domain-containing protein n=1 Tax=Alternaria burnsii TaxID=1187904 RepID=A0A8H7AW11_9PLEO|nr:uncharacterized protein GT037_009152 [Alternaria burnsii]KAF7672651.1 hypothetical protein GT037_009152 [Alternaria burnsii]CAI9627609.1 unnamed protein product [Alternaria burnsii]
MPFSFFLKPRWKRVTHLDNHSVRRYTYKALGGPEYIRLMILHPASSGDAPLKFTFQQARLSELQGRYEAISYTWGQPNLTYPLYVGDGTHVLVTENLDRALRYLRHSHKDRALWADAACINQADDVEKGRQIPLMGQIFQNAKTVLAWLDPGSAVSRSHDLELTLKRMENMFRNRRQDVLSEMMEPDGKGVTALFWERFGEVSELLRLPWFTRRWIVQEVAFNSEVRLIYGDVELTWTRFVGAISILSTLNLETANPETRVWNSLPRLARLWRHHALFERFSITGENYPDTDILKLMDDFDQHGCADPRDRIFALYNMASNMRSSTATSPHDDILMDINYSLDLKQTYEAFALACMRAGKQTTIIEAVLSRQHSAQQHSWASWAPDWRVSWLEPVVLPNPISFFQPPKLKNWPVGVICIWVNTCKSLLHVQYRACPIIAEKAVGDTLLQQCSNLCTKVNKKTAAGDLKSFFDMLQCMVQQSHRTSDMGGMLAQQLQRMRSKVYTTDPQCDPKFHLMNLDALQSMLNTIIGQSKKMFFFEIPRTKQRSVGYSNAHLEVGDQLVPLSDLHAARSGYTLNLGPRYLKMVLIVRSAGTLNMKPSPENIYRLIGSGYVYDPLVSTGADLEVSLFHSKPLYLA